MASRTAAAGSQEGELGEVATDSQVTSSHAQNETSSQIPADLLRSHHPPLWR